MTSLERLERIGRLAADMRVKIMGKHKLDHIEMLAFLSKIEQLADERSVFGAVTHPAWPERAPKPTVIPPLSRDLSFKDMDDARYEGSPGYPR